MDGHRSVASTARRILSAGAAAGEEGIDDGPAERGPLHAHAPYVLGPDVDLARGWTSERRRLALCEGAQAAVEVGVERCASGGIGAEEVGEGRGGDDDDSDGRWAAVRDG